MPPLPIRRALISVSDKGELDILVRALHEEFGVEIVSTGGTATFIEGLGIPVTRVEDVTGFPEIMDGRVKTLHPKIHAGLLARRDVPEHVAALEAHGIAPIDLLVVNLYPFEKTVADPGVSLEDAIENIDIGGPAMIRAAAKNFEHVAVVTSQYQYADLIEDLGFNDGCSLELRRRLAAEAFARTAAYDSAITNFLAGQPGFNAPWIDPWRDTEASEAERVLPPRLAIPLVKVRDLRYGENPHQQAAVFVPDGRQWVAPQRRHDLAATVPLHGKPLSYNNLLDANAAVRLARDLAALRPDRTSAVVVKHTNPCGAAVAGDAVGAITAALAGDPLAAYGGILATTETLDAPAAERLIAKGTFLEVIVARGFTDEALGAITAKSKNVRLLALDTGITSQPSSVELEVRHIDGGFVAQTPDTTLEPFDTWQLRAGEPVDNETARAAEVVWAICKALSSNAIAIGGIGEPGSGEPGHAVVRLFGAGAGQMDRVASCRIAVSKAGELAEGAIAASDAFFPFPDGPQVLIDAGVRTIVHPGGSKRDEETFALCRERGVACYTTGRRHFRH